jgi:bacterioferritin-associated ferredoxin
MYVCVCHGIREGELRQAIDSGHCRFEELQSRTGVATGCGACEIMACDLFNRAREEHARRATSAC